MTIVGHTSGLLLRLCCIYRVPPLENSFRCRSGGRRDRRSGRRQELCPTHFCWRGVVACFCRRLLADRARHADLERAHCMRESCWWDGAGEWRGKGKEEVSRGGGVGGKRDLYSDKESQYRKVEIALSLLSFSQEVCALLQQLPTWLALRYFGGGRYDSSEHYRHVPK